MALKLNWNAGTFHSIGNRRKVWIARGNELHLLYKVYQVGPNAFEVLFDRDRHSFARHASPGVSSPEMRTYKSLKLAKEAITEWNKSEVRQHTIASTAKAAAEHLAMPKVSKQVRQEIHAVIKRYGKESDLHAYQLIGILEVVKADILELLAKHGN